MALGKQPARDTVNMILFSRVAYAVNSNHEDLGHSVYTQCSI